MTGPGIEPGACGSKVEDAGKTSFRQEHSQHINDELLLGIGQRRTPRWSSVAEGSGSK
jgi:hypothetical protein